MSESIAQAAQAVAAEMAAETAAAAPVQPAAPEAPAAAAPETPAAAPEAAETPAEGAAGPETPKPKQSDRRFAHLTAKLATEAAAREAAEKRAAAAEALLNAGKETPAAPAAPTETVEQAAARIVAEREYNARRAALVEAGSKELGDAAWNEKTEVLAQLGATANQSFMQALVELPGAPKVVAHLADDADALVALLGKSPVAMAAEMGRLAAELNRPTPPRLSNAPRPAASVTPAVVTPEPDLNDENMPMSEWVKLFDKTSAGQKLMRMGRR